MLYTDRDQILHGVKVMISVFKKKESTCLFRCDVYLEFLNRRRGANSTAALIILFLVQMRRLFEERRLIDHLRYMHKAIHGSLAVFVSEPVHVSSLMYSTES